MDQNISAPDPASELLRVIRRVVDDLSPSPGDTSIAIASKRVARWSAILFVAAYTGTKVL